jgi:hypothetical protein
MASSSEPARPLSPSNSFYALSDDEEGEYNTITHTTTGRGVKLLYSKSKARMIHSPDFVKRQSGVETRADPSIGVYTSHSVRER